MGVSTALMERAELRANAVLGAKAPTEAVKAKVQAKTNFMVYWRKIQSVQKKVRPLERRSAAQVEVPSAIIDPVGSMFEDSIKTDAHHASRWKLLRVDDDVSRTSQRCSLEKVSNLAP